MTRIFGDSWRRIERAIVHAKALQAQFNFILSKDAFATSIEINANWTEGIVKSIPKLNLRHDIALELGEFFYQLRAALDAAIYQVAAIAENADAPANEDSVQFPICHTPDSFRRSIVTKPPFPAEVRDWLESIQPYNAAKTMSDRSVNTYLKLLHDCARKDRHRRLHIVAVIPTEVKWEFEITKPGQITYKRGLPVDLLQGESPILVFGLSGFSFEDGKRLKLKTQLRVEIVVDDLPIPPGSNLGEQLDMVLRATERVIQTLEDGYEWPHGA